MSVMGAEQLGKSTFISKVQQVSLAVGDSAAPSQTTRGVSVVSKVVDAATGPIIQSMLDTQGTGTTNVDEIAELLPNGDVELAADAVDLRLGALVTSLDVPVIYFLRSPPTRSDLVTISSIFKQASALRSRGTAHGAPKLVFVFRGNHGLDPKAAYDKFRPTLLKRYLAEDPQAAAMLVSDPPLFNLWEDPTQQPEDYIRKVELIINASNSLASTISFDAFLLRFAVITSAVSDLHAELDILALSDEAVQLVIAGAIQKARETYLLGLSDEDVVSESQHASRLSAAMSCYDRLAVGDGKQNARDSLKDELVALYFANYAPCSQLALCGQHPCPKNSRVHQIHCGDNVIHKFTCPNGHVREYQCAAGPIPRCPQCCPRRFVFTWSLRFLCF
jgi:hypothetical protein